ncbi:hypothetical protein [Pseudomonas sp. Pf153]|uniref:hypothetical protein n=1 Tax=Pseudomonas sp. Pf153 TaxID=1699309 RepID=UPI000AEEA5E4|nr:hypothetical protein [Pseudomonas sp. Pf153]
MNVQKRIKRNLLGSAADLPTSTWPPEWKRRMGSGFSGADLIYVSSNETQRRYVYLYGEAEAAIEFDLPIDLRLTAEPGYQVRFLYQPTQQASENPRVVAYFNAGTHFWTRELQTSAVNATTEPPRDWLVCDDKIVLNDEITLPKAALAFQSGLFDPAAAADATSEHGSDLPVTQEPAWPTGPGEVHFSGRALGAAIDPEMAQGVSVFVHLKPLELSTNEPMPEFNGSSARYWVEKDGRVYMPICRGARAHHFTLPVVEACGWAGGGMYAGTSVYASFTDPNEAGQAGLQVAPTDPDADDDAQHVSKTWEIRSDAQDLSVNGRTATLRFESIYHAEPYEALACIVGPYKLDITDHGQPDYWPSVEEEETIDLHVSVRYAVSGNWESGAAVEWRHEDDLLETVLTGEEGLAVFGYQPTTDATVTAVVDSPYKPEAETRTFVVKTIPTRKWAQFELSVNGAGISPDDHWWILPGQSYELTLKPCAGSVLIGQDLAFTVDPAQRLQLEPTGNRPLAASGLTWSITTAANVIGDFALRLDCIRFKQPLTLSGGINELPALTIVEAPGDQLDPMAAMTMLTALVPQYDGMHSTDKIRVTWTGAAGSPTQGSHTTAPIEVGTIGEKPIPLPVSLIAYSLGQSVTVNYTVTPDSGNESPPSDLFHLTVQPLTSDDLLESKPRITQAANSGEGPTLDLRVVTGDCSVRIEGWPHIAKDQYVWLRLKGFKADGSAHDRTIWQPPSRVTQGEYDQGYLPANVPYSYIKDLGDSRTLTVEFKVAFDKTTEETQAVTFPLRTYTVRAPLNLSAPRVKQATGTSPSQQLNPVAAKDALTVVIPEYGVLPDDQVRVTWTGTAGGGSHTTAAQALPGNREIPIPIDVIAYNLGKSVSVTFVVIRNGETSDPSVALNLAVQTFTSGDLQASQPRITQAANNGEGLELNLDDVTDGASVRIDGWPHIAIDQYVWLRLKGFKADGSTHDRTIWQPPSRVTPGEYGQGYLPANVPYTYLKDLGDSRTLTVEFKVAFDKTTDEAQAVTFPLRTYTVRAPLNLSAPRVKQATGTSPSQQLNPVAAKDALTVVIPEYGVLPDDQVRVTWTGTAGEGSHTTSAQALPANREIPIPIGVIAYNLGRPVAVTFVVIRNGEPSDPSVALNLAVQTIASSDLQASKPRITQAANNGEGLELDLDDVTGGASVRIDGWPHIAVGQYVWLRLKGFKADGSTHDRIIWQPPSRVTPGEYGQGYLPANVPYDYLRELGDGKTLTVEFKVAFDKATNEAQALTFPLRSYTIKQEMVKPTIDSLKDANDKEIPGGIFERFTVSTRLKLSGQANRGRNVAIVDSREEDANIRGQATAHLLTGTWEFTFTVPVGRYSFWAKALYPFDGYPYSGVRHVEVVPLIVPILKSVRGTDHQDIPNGGSTSSRELSLAGNASLGQKVEIFDGSGASAVSKGEVKANIYNGGWTLRITVGPGDHRFYAKSLYHSGAPVYSNVRTLTVRP